MRIDMEFLFECSTRYLTSKDNERLRYKVKHEKRNSTSKGPGSHAFIILFII